MSGERKLADTPIAIVGMAGLFPMAGNFREYWQNIVDARDCTTDVPADRWNPADHHDPDPSTPDRTYATRGGFVPDVPFDPVEFGLPPNQLEITSTLQTLSLVVARDLLRDAGTDAPWYDPQRTGAVLGVTGPVPLVTPLGARLTTPVLREVVRSCGLTDAEAETIADKFSQAFAPWEENSFPGLLANVTAGRIANRLGLGGMNATVDAACAASLAAVRMAVAELVDGRADMMITGGADTANSIFMYMCFSKTQALSKEDQIRPFDAAADGTLLGEGIGMLALRRLADAERDGNRIYAVIRGIGSASDGRAKSIYAPRAEGQQLALRRAYADADCSPASVGLFEAHATGTAVGDRTELTALAGVLKEATDEPRFAAIGSVKSQIGHTKGAAGAASLMKLALSLHQRTLPPTINVRRPNSPITEPDAPFYVNTRTRPWVRDPARPVRRAGASAMGFGGTNFHVVLEEHSTGPVLQRSARAYLWHAPDVTTLTELVRTAPPSDSPIPADAVRLGFVAADVPDAARLRELAVTQLTGNPDLDEWSHPAGIFFRARALPDLKVGALFAGQGSQYLDMGLETVLHNPTVAAAFDTANATFAGADRTLADVVFPPETFDADARGEQEAMLHRTEYAQPAIGTLAVGQFQHLTELGLDCAGFLGHSFGELTALWASGALTTPDFFRLARARGQAMTIDGAEQGAMAAVEADRDRVTALLAAFPDVVVCNHNAPDQVVVGGAGESVAALVEECQRQGLTTRRLSVSAAFHTRYVADAVDRFRPAVEATTIGVPARPVYANSPGTTYGPDVRANRETLVQQLVRPVEFVTGLRAMHSAGCNVFVEFGPKQILTHLVRRTLGATAIAIPTDAGPLGDGDVALRQAAVRLAVLGASLVGLNRHIAPEFEAVPAGPASVLLNGAEHVPESRKAAYQAALSDGFQITRGAGTEAGVVDAAEDVVRQHLAVHSRYLEGQLRITEGLVDAMRHTEDVPGLLRVADRVRQQSVEIGRTHLRANEILATIAGLTDTPPPLGTPPVPTPVPVAPMDDVDHPVVEPAASGDVDTTRTALLDLVAQRTGYPASMIDTGMDLEADLGVDSIKRVQILGAVQERFPGVPAVGPERLAEMRTLDDIINFVVAGGGPTADQRGSVADQRGTGADRRGSVADSRGSSKTASMNLVDVVPVPVGLVPLPPVDPQVEPFRATPEALVVAEDGPDVDAVVAELTKAGWSVRRSGPGRLDLCVRILPPVTDWSAATDVLAETVLLAGAVVGELATTSAHARAGFVTMTRLDGRLGLAGTRPAAEVVTGGVSGIVKTLAREEPTVFCRAVDVDPAVDPAAAAGLLLTEIADAALDVHEVGVTADGQRWTVQPAKPVRPSGDLVVGPRDLFVVTGGARGVTAACVRALAERSGAEFVLLGRTELVQEPEWATGVPDAGLRDALISANPGKRPREIEEAWRTVVAQREVRATFAAVNARYLTVDVTDPAAVRQALAPFAGKVTGIVHGAGTLADALVRNKTDAQVRHVLNPKLAGLHAVLDALADAPLRHVLLFTSVAGLFGNTGQADYAAANEALHRVAASLRREDLRVTAIDWGAWDGGMVTDELRDLFASRGVPLLPVDVGGQAFVEQFTAGATEPRVLLGSAMALDGPARTTPRALTACRDVGDLAASEALRAHRIGGFPVLPATFGLGWLINVVERANPGLRVVESRGFEVHKGIVFTGDHDRSYRVELEPDGLTVLARVRGDLRAHYSGTFVLAEEPAPGPEPLATTWSDQVEASGLYTDGTLFHGPALQGIRRLAERSADRLVAECRLTDLPTPGYTGVLHSPVLADLLLQAACLLAGDHTGLPSLPLGIDRWEFFAPLPDNTPFTVIADEPHTGPAATVVNVRAYAADGTPLARLTGVAAVGSAELSARFVDAVRDGSSR